MNTTVSTESKGLSKLNPKIRTPSTPQEMRTALAEVLTEGEGGALQEAKAEDYAERIVVAEEFDSPAALADLTEEDLKDMGIPKGHQKLVRRIIFGGPCIEEGSAGGDIPHFTVEWPLCTGYPPRPKAAEMSRWAIALAGHLKVQGGGWRDIAEECMDHVRDPAAEITPTYPHGAGYDLMLANALVSAGKKGMPLELLALCKSDLEADHGMRAWKRVCAAVFARTAQSGRDLKRAVRSPGPATAVVEVPNLLSCWDADLREGEAKGYLFDEHDRQTALLGCVRSLKRFEATVSALETRSPLPGWEEIRRVLGERADDLAKAERDKMDDRERSKAKAVALAAAADGEGEWMEAPKPRSKGKPKGKPRPKQKSKNKTAAAAEAAAAAAAAERIMQKDKPCRDFFRSGSCSYSPCIFSHGAKLVAHRNRYDVLADPEVYAKLQKKFVAKMTRVYKGLVAESRPLTDPQSTTSCSRRLRTRTRPSGEAFTARVMSCIRGFRASKRRGAVADSGADAHFLGEEDVGEAVNKRAVDPVVVETAQGAAKATQVADLERAGGCLDAAYILRGCGESLCSVGAVCEQHGVGYEVAPGNVAARFFTEGGSTWLQLEKDGRRFRLPPDVPDKLSAYAAKVPSWYFEHCKRGHPHRPDCEHCVRGRFRGRRSERLAPGERRSPDGYTMSADFTGRHAEDVEGYTVALVCCVHGYEDEPDEAEAAYGFVALLKERTAAATAQALDEFDRLLKELGKDKSRQVVRFHTDVDSSFLGKAQQLAVRKGWRVTDTGGYKSAANGIVERRIGLLKQTVRTILLAATGGVYYYEELWGHGLIRANQCLNQNDWRTRVSPHQQLTGKPYVWGPHEHAFGTYCTWGVPQESRWKKVSCEMPGLCVGAVAWLLAVRVGA